MANHRATPASKPLAKGPVRVRAKHAADITRPDWRANRRKFALSATAVIMSALLVAPTPALAATYLEVDGTGYDAANGAASGEGWSWDGADNMVLDGFNGDYIYAEGALNIQLEGENTLSGQAPANPSDDLKHNGDGIGVYDSFNEVVDENGEKKTSMAEEGDLTITGDGSLSVTGGEAGFGIYANGSIDIEGTSVEVSAEGKNVYGVRSDYEDISIKDSNLSVSTNANIKENGKGGISTGIFTYEGDITVENSTVNVDATGDKAAFAIRASDEGLQGNLTITDSDVTVNTQITGEAPEDTLTGSWGVSAFNGDVTIENSKVNVKNSGGMGGDGIAAYGSEVSEDEDKNPAHEPTITIKNSDVSVAGFADSAIASVFYNAIGEDGKWDADAAKKGRIVIEGSFISLPYGAKALDAVILGDGEAACGQIVGTGEGTLASWDDPAIARELAMKSVQSAVDEAIKDSGLATTGDGANPAPLLAAGLTAAAAAAFARRQLKE